MARQIQPTTPLARLILDSGKPAYVVAGEVGISYNRLLDYADGRASPGHAHEVKLVRYFGQPLNDSHDSHEDRVDEAFEHPVRFVGVVRGARLVPRADVVVTLLVGQLSDERDVLEAWRLAGASGVIFDVRVHEPIMGLVEASFTASVEDVRIRPGIGLEVRLRVPAEERDAVLRVGWVDGPKVFHFAVPGLLRLDDR
jgi:hypothetical protein